MAQFIKQTPDKVTPDDTRNSENKRYNDILR